MSLLLHLDYFILILMHLKTLKEVSKLSQNLTWTQELFKCKNPSGKTHVSSLSRFFFVLLLYATLMFKFVRLKRPRNGHRFDCCADIM